MKKSMAGRREALHTYMVRQFTLESSVIKLLQKYKEDTSLQDQYDALRLLMKAESVLSATSALLHESIEINAPLRMNGNHSDSIRIVPAEPVGCYRVTEILREQHTLLSSIGIGYTMLHSLARGLQIKHCEKLALNSLKAITPVIAEIYGMLPRIALAEVTENSNDSGEFPETEAVRAISAAWQPAGMDPVAGGHW